MPKNLVVCCDGTGNEFGGDENSNVVKLYTCLQEGKTKQGEQLVYYHPGVGTMGSPSSTTRVGKQWTKVKGLAFGGGFLDNLADAYRFLMANYAEGDRIYLFGFSRGAYTVRSLAGALFMYGLLCPGNEGHLPYLLHMYATASKKHFNDAKSRGGRSLHQDQTARAFLETFSREVPIHFLGIWDTVSSVGWIYDPVKLLYDAQNGAVRKGRHAVSVSERRCYFQDMLWGPALRPEEPETRALQNAYDPENRRFQQDILQVWFAGVHSDVGGSYKQKECGPAMNALQWMFEEAVGDGLLVNGVKCAAVFGRSDPNRSEVLAGIHASPNPAHFCMHESLTWKWWPLELLPHKYFDGKGNPRWQFEPWPHLREIPDGAYFHPSLLEHLDRADPVYKPGNLGGGRVERFTPADRQGSTPEVTEALAAKGYGVFHRTPATASVETPGLAKAAMVGVGIGGLLLLSALARR